MPYHKVTDIVHGSLLAPEIYKGNAYDSKVDTWNYGVILYKMLTGTSHYPGLETVYDIKTIASLYKSFKLDLQPLTAR
jgi:serine/threonine protein kinase